MDPLTPNLGETPYRFGETPNSWPKFRLWEAQSRSQALVEPDTTMERSLYLRFCKYRSSCGSKGRPSNLAPFATQKGRPLDTVHSKGRPLDTVHSKGRPFHNACNEANFDHRLLLATNEFVGSIQWIVL